MRTRGPFSWLIAASFFLFSCTNPPYQGPDVVGADEFVIDSYKIQQGKFSILELSGEEVEPLSDEMLKPPRDELEDGDVLHLVFFHPSRGDLCQAIKEISESVGFRVFDGEVTLPTIGTISVEGMTIKEARKTIQEAYCSRIPDVTIFVSFKERKKKKVELLGLVSTPSITISTTTRLFDVLSQAKIPNEANLFKSYVVREDKFVPVDMYRLVHQGDMSQNIVMRSGDKIFIASAAASTIMVLGEVTKEGVLNIPSGFLPLREAIAQAGGIASTADKSYIQVIRGSILKPKIYTIHWKHVVRLPTKSLLLMPGDIVYVAARPITEWNRFVNQILPTLSTYELLKKNVKGILIP